MIGDVGFIREGQFHLLFSASCPLGERQLGEDVPATFEELAVGPPVFRQPRPPGCLRTNSVREIGAGFDAAVSTTMYVPPFRLPSAYHKNVPLGPWKLAQVSHLSLRGIVVRHW